MSLSKIVQESLEKHKGTTLWVLPVNVTKVHGADGSGGFIYQGLEINFEKELISSHISLIEAEIARKKGMLKEDDHGMFCHCSSHGYNQAINQDIDYLQVELEITKKLN